MKKYLYTAVAALAAIAPQTIMAEDATEEPDYMYVGKEVLLDQEGKGTVVVYLNTTETKMNAFEMNIYLPEGFTIEKNSRGKYVFQFNTEDDVIVDHSMACNDNWDGGNGRYRIVGASVSMSYILPGDNWIFKFNITAPEGFNETAEAHMQDIMFASGGAADGKKHYYDNCYFEIIPYNVQTGVTTVDAVGEDDVIYTLQGIRVERPLQPGIYIINGKKTNVK